MVSIDEELAGGSGCNWRWIRKWRLRIVEADAKELNTYLTVLARYYIRSDNEMKIGEIYLARCPPKAAAEPSRSDCIIIMSF